MVGTGFLPCCIYKNKLHFLFGKESPVERNAPGWSDFVGSLETSDGQNLYKGAIREAVQEMSGFLGNEKEFAALVQKNGGVLHLCLSKPSPREPYSTIEIIHDSPRNPAPPLPNTYHIYIFRLDYEPWMVEYFNKSHKYLYEALNWQALEKTRVFEKVEIKWFSLEEARKKKREFRCFYGNILDLLKEKEQDIKRFIRVSGASRRVA